MPLIDSTYFKGEILIPNLSDAAELAALNEAIERYEPEFLEKLLGTELYELFWAAYEASILEVDPVALATRYGYILNGHSYDYSNYPHRWKGLINTPELSPIAHYVWYRYMSQPRITGVGIVQPKSENADVVSMRPALVRVWNQMVKWNLSGLHMLLYLPNGEDRYYPEYRFPYHASEVYYPINVFGI